MQLFHYHIILLFHFIIILLFHLQYSETLSMPVVQDPSNVGVRQAARVNFALIESKLSGSMMKDERLGLKEAGRGTPVRIAHRLVFADHLAAGFRLLPDFG